MTFEEQLRRLEYIVETLDRGDEPLEKLMSLYQEGMELSRSCREYLERAEQKIIEIKNSSMPAKAKQRRTKTRPESDGFEAAPRQDSTPADNSTDDSATDEEPELPF